MNILEIEDIIKGLPDNRLVQEAQAPTGRLPQFLVVSEIQRRADMRRRFQSQQEQPKGTVAQQILSGGIGSLPQPSFTPPSPVAASAAPPPSALAGAGEAPIKMSGGRLTPYVDWRSNLPPSLRDGRGLLDFGDPNLDAVAAQAGAPTAASPEANLTLDPAQFTPELGSLLSPETIAFLENQPAAPASVASAQPATQEQGANESTDVQELSATARDVGTLLENPLFSGLRESNAEAPDFSSYSTALRDLQGQTSPVVDYSSFIKANKEAAKRYADEYSSLGDIYMAEAEKEAESIRAQAKKDALTAALMQIGAGVAAGDISSGLSGAATSVQAALSQAGKEALAERRAGRLSGREAAESARRLGIGAEQTALELGARGEEARVAGEAQDILREVDIATRLAELGLQESRYASDAANREIQAKRDMAISLFSSINNMKEQGRLTDRAVIGAISEYVKTAVGELVGGDPETERRKAIREAINLYGDYLRPGQSQRILEALEISAGAAPQGTESDESGFGAEDA